MLLFVLRKMAANRWMVVSLLVGVILAVAMVTTIPIYSRGILTRLLLRDLQIYQESSGRFPGFVEVSGYLPVNLEAENKLAVYDDYSSAVQREVGRGLRVPLLSQSFRLRHDYLRARRVDQPESDSTSVAVSSVSGLLERVTPVIGRLPERLDSGGNTIEAVITEEMAAVGRIVYGNEYQLISPRDDTVLDYTVRIVGVVAVREPGDLFWSVPIRRFSGTLLVQSDVVRRLIESDPFVRNVQVAWAFTFDYQALSSEQATPLARFIQEQTEAGRRLGISIQMPVLRILKEYAGRERTLKLTLWMLQVPLLLMLAFYLSMVSQVLINHERNEIALMKSRGADGLQIFFTYVLLGTLPSLAGIAAGPFLGMAICRVPGASNGFLEFVQRRPLRLELTPQTYFYGVAAAAFALGTMLLPGHSGVPDDHRSP